MPTRFLVAIGALLLSLSVATEVSANWFLAIFDDVARQTKRRQCWPDPFVAPDVMDVHAPFCKMVENGWRRQNMLTKDHFDKETGKLNEAGINKVRWILYVCPTQHRLVYVHIGDTEQETRAREEAVAKLVAQITPHDVPPILTTSISEDGWSAHQADLIGRKYIDSIPDPRLPANDSDMSPSGTSN